MDTLLRALIRQYTVGASDELAHRIATALLRSGVGESDTRSFEEKIRDYRQSLDALRSSLEPEIEPALRGLLQKYPTVKAFYWTQYTPYFNDGDRCEFSVNDVSVSFKDVSNDSSASEQVRESDEEVEDEPAEEDEDNYDYDERGGFLDYYSLGRDDPRRIVIQEINSFVQAIPADLMESAFGDGMRVVVDRDGVETMDYEHE